MITLGKEQGKMTYFCPFIFFEESLKEEYIAKVTKMMSDWEDFKNDSSIYSESNQPIPGCACESITDAELNDK